MCNDLFTVNNDPTADVSTHSSDSDLADRARPFRLLVIDARNRETVGTDLALGAQPAVVGRQSDGTSLAVADSKMSRQHFSITKKSRTAFILTDLGSKHGTFVDAVRVAGERALTPGAIVRAGTTLFEFSRRAPRPPGVEPDPEFLGESVAHLKIIHAIATISGVSLPVLIKGETGTGKELIANRIHAASGRTGPLIAVNCATIPPTLAESYLFGHRKGAFTGATGPSQGCVVAADGGTLFLDEIGDLPLELQPKLLRVLETGEVTALGATTTQQVDVRFVAASHVDVRDRAEDGRFRLDLYARLAGLPLEVPSLRQRRSDIPLLVRHFLSVSPFDEAAASIAGGPSEVAPDAMEALVLYDWPMNVRELRNVMGRVAVMNRGSDVLGLRMLPSEIQAFDGRTGAAASAPARARSAQKLTRDHVAELLGKHQGNVSQVARELGKDRTQIYRLLKRFGIDPTDYRADGETQEDPA